MIRLTHAPSTKPRRNPPRVNSDTGRFRFRDFEIAYFSRVDLKHTVFKSHGTDGVFAYQSREIENATSLTGLDLITHSRDVSQPAGTSFLSQTRNCHYTYRRTNQSSKTQAMEGN